MGQGIFIAGTDTEIGKTYVSALLCRCLKEQNFNVAYYKAAASGEGEFYKSDAGRVRAFANLEQEPSTMVSYLYQEPLSPHLAGRLNQRLISLDKVIADFKKVRDSHDLTVVEGSGGVICPLVYEENSHLLLWELMQKLELDVLLVARAGLGTINHTVLTTEFLRSRGITVRAIILNGFEKGNLLHEDNALMIESLTKLPIAAKIAQGEQNFNPLIDLKCFI